MSDTRAAVACALSEQEFKERQRYIGREILPGADIEETAAGYRLRFDSDEALRQKLEEFVAFERECCGGLRFGLEESEGKLALDIAGDARAKQALAALLRGDAGCGCGAAPCADASAAAAPLARFKRSRWGQSGLAVAAASVLVCELPLVLALVGFGGALSFSALASAILVAVVASPLLFWIWRRRRAGLLPEGRQSTP